MCCRLPSSFATSVDQWDSQAAAGICGVCLLYVAFARLKTSAVRGLMCGRVGSTHVTNLVSEQVQKYPKCKREGAVGVDGERDE